MTQPDGNGIRGGLCGSGFLPGGPSEDHRRKGSRFMDTQTAHRQIGRRMARRRGMVALAGAVSLLTIGAGSMSLAQFTDSSSATWAFATGTIDISTSPTVLTALSNMMPGDTSTQAL